MENKNPKKRTSNSVPRAIAPSSDRLRVLKVQHGELITENLSPSDNMTDSDRHHPRLRKGKEIE